MVGTLTINKIYLFITKYVVGVKGRAQIASEYGAAMSLASAHVRSRQPKPSLTENAAPSEADVMKA